MQNKNMNINNPTFGGFKPDAMSRIAKTLGYDGEMTGFQQYLDQNPDKRTQMDQFKQAAMRMAKGGAVRNYQVGGFSAPNTAAGMTTIPTVLEPSDPIPTQPVQTQPQPTIPKVIDPITGEPPFIGGPARPMPIDPITGEPPITGGPVLPMPTPKDPIDSRPMPITPPELQPQPPVEEGPDLGGYDPSKGMPEALPDEFITSYTTDQPSWAKKGLTEMFKSGKLPEDPADFTSESLGNRQYKITYKDGTTMEVGPIGKFDTEPDAIRTLVAEQINKFKNSPEYTQKLAQQNAYRSYLTEQTSGGVTGDLENIEQEYTTAQNNYTQQNLELQRLQAQADANPDDPYLKELVEAKGVELSETLSRLEQLGPLYQSTQKTIEDEFKDRATDPTLPEGAGVNATLIGAPMQEELIGAGSGQVTGSGGVDSVTLAGTATAAAVTQPETATYEADLSQDKVMSQTAALEAAQTDPDDPRAKVTAQETTRSMIRDLDAAQGTGILMDNPVQRKIEAGELVSGAANAQTASKFMEEVQAATAQPSQKATVAGQLDQLMADFEGGETPAWAAGAMRTAMQTMSARGLGASSMAGQAVVQAAMESALPIAQADASIFSQFEQQNLSNRQQRAMLAAQQRAQFLGQEFDQEFQARVANASKISDIANMNFTAEQTIALENSRIVNTMELTNLGNRQAMVIAEASALANLDLSNLNNRQQSQVQNAQNFLQMDMANLSNRQQTSIFKTQQNIQSILSDQAATNAAQQFNAQSTNQANQFYDNLNSTVNMFNAEQTNAQERFNAGQVNAADQFNANMKNNREQFNAKNQLVVDQSNATWRREIATQDTAAINRANELNAMNTLDISNTAYNNMWNMYNDQMSWAVSSYESEAQRLNALALETLRQEGSAAATKYANDAKASGAIGSAIISLLTAGKDSVLGGLFF